MHLTEEKSGGGRCCGARFEGKLSTGLVVRFALKNRHRQPGLSGPKSAKSRHHLDVREYEMQVRPLAVRAISPRRQFMLN